MLSHIILIQFFSIVYTHFFFQNINHNYPNTTLLDNS